jgi:hypothetical protein
VIDAKRLLAWLDTKAVGRSVVVHSIYKGLAERIRRGDFDKEQGEEEPDGLGEIRRQLP